MRDEGKLQLYQIVSWENFVKLTTGVSYTCRVFRLV